MHPTPPCAGPSPRSARGPRPALPAVLAPLVALALALALALGAAIPAAAGQRAGMQAGVAAVGQGCGSGAASTPDPAPAPDAQPAAEDADDPAGTPAPAAWAVPEGIRGLDVSHWNGLPSFVKLYRKGMRFVFSKATQGIALRDPTYDQHTREARAAGLEVGAYHFFDYNMPGQEQALHFLGQLRATTGLDGLLPLVVDVECLKTLGSSDQAAARKRLHALMDELYAQTGRYPMIYTSRAMWKQVVGAPTAFGRYPLWVACWECDTVLLPNGWQSWRFWQTGQQRFIGIGLLDHNVYSSTEPARLAGERQRAVVLAGGADFARQRSTSADLGAVDGAEARVALGDEPFGPWQPYAAALPIELADAEGPQVAQVQLRSFRGVLSPVFSDEVSLDSVPPDIRELTVSMVQDARLPLDGSRVPGGAAMRASDETSGLDSTSLELRCGTRSHTQASSIAEAGLRAPLDRSGCSVVAKAIDRAGHRGRRALKGIRISLLDARPGTAGLALKGTWQNVTSERALRQTILRSTGAGAQAKLRVSGSQLAIVARKGRDGGRATVTLDGEPVVTLDLYASKPQQRRVVLVIDLPPGEHVVVVENAGEGRRASAGTTLDLDAFLVLERRGG
jgi:GH25 family lysozyme M1 (1,4-beta-N-acetylmuramidase)